MEISLYDFCRGNESPYHVFLKHIAVRFLSTHCGAHDVGMEIEIDSPRRHNGKGTRVDVIGISTVRGDYWRRYPVLHGVEVVLNPYQPRHYGICSIPENMWVLTLKGALSVKSLSESVGLLEFDQLAFEQSAPHSSPEKHLNVVRRCTTNYHPDFVTTQSGIQKLDQELHEKYCKRVEAKIHMSNQQLLTRRNAILKSATYWTSEQKSDVKGKHGANMLKLCKHNNEEHGQG